MKIAYLSSAWVPSRTANSIHVMKMCQALASAGNEVVLFAPTQSKSRDLELVDEFDYYGVKRNFSIRFLPWRSRSVGGAWFRLNSALQVRLLGFELAFGRGLAACCVSAWLGVPVIYETHAPVEAEGLLGRILFSSLISSGSFRHLVVISDALRRNFEEVWPALKGRVVVAPDGADYVSRKVRPVELSGTGKRLQVGYAGNLFEGKGAELVVELARARPQFDFHIVGGTHADLLSWQERPNLPANLRIHGYQPHREIPSYLLAFDVALLPNQPIVRLEHGSQDIGQWTSPLKLFEYMAAGRAIICSDVSVLQEVADDGINMLVCRHDDVSDWASALDRLHSNPNLRKSLGEVARRQLESLYSWDRRASFLLNLVPVSGKS